MLYVNPLSGPGALQAGAPETPERQRAALQELEHMFLFTLLQEMRKSVPEDTLLGGGPQRKHFDEMFDDAISSEMAKSGQFGLARQMEQQLDHPKAVKLGESETELLRDLVDEGLHIKEAFLSAVKGE